MSEFNQLDADRKTHFPLTEASMRGYDRTEVDEFLAKARLTFEGKQQGNQVVTAADIRRTSFTLKKRGYEPRFVDAALDRLEEVLFERERYDFITEHSEDQWDELVTSLEHDLRSRLERPRKDRFRSVSFLSHGYRKAQVDAITDQLLQAMNSNIRVTTQEVRNLRFHLQRGGYDETQVDVFLDAYVEFLLATK